MSEAIPLGIVDEARRVMDICNACRYCEGICATFQAMSLRRSFEDGELQHLANLCHNCTACYHDCQYAPPHVFDVNVPRSMTELRNETYAAHAWPGFLGSLFHRNGLVVSLATAAALTFVLGAALALVDPGLLFGVHTGPGSFYRVVGHGVMVSVAGASFGFSMLALVMGLRRYWRAAGIPLPIRAIPGAFALALRDAATLRHLGGGHGEG